MLGNSSVRSSRAQPPPPQPTHCRLSQGTSRHMWPSPRCSGSVETRNMGQAKLVRLFRQLGSITYHPSRACSTLHHFSTKCHNNSPSVTLFTSFMRSDWSKLLVTAFSSVPAPLTSTTTAPLFFTSTTAPLLSTP
ncbi:hypothetical protein PIB30_007701 [Stylosanthes scabra]|uniref:Uncharacterized protein n=1 Tax=Stylosanthes scabra TaxID=79078 RepID=A0ABU6X203_9FABA|nr:hypothetical protein [Stylosanthes scabra]